MKKLSKKKLFITFILSLISLTTVSSVSIGSSLSTIDSCLEIDGYFNGDIDDPYNEIVGGYENDTTKPTHWQKDELQGSGLVLSKDNIKNYCNENPDYNGNINYYCDLENKQIVDILPGTFSGMNIQNLNMGSNYLTGINKSMFEGIVGVENINFKNNNISNIEEGTFDGLNPNSLDFSFNNISNLHSNIFQNISNLEYIDFSSNNIQNFESINLNGLNNLNSIDFSYNNINSINGTTFSGLDNLSYIDFSHNKISELNSKTFVGLKRFYNINFSYNNISIIKSKAFENLSSDGGGEIHLDHNNISILQPGSFSNVDYNNQDINGIHSLISGGRGDNLMDLSYNNISNIENGVFENVKGLENLIISYNSINNSSNFQNLPKSISTLKACINNIDHINKTDFSGFENLTNVGLASNKIEYVETGTFEGMNGGLDTDGYPIKDISINFSNNFLKDMSNNPESIYNSGSNYSTTNGYYINLNNNCLVGDIYDWNGNLLNQFVCPYIKYTPHYPTQENVVGNILFTGDATGTNLLTQNNSGDSRLTHTWFENGPYTFDITGINNMESLAKIVIRDINDIHTYYQVPKTIIPANVDWMLPKSSSSSSISSIENSSSSSSSSSSSQISSSSSSISSTISSSSTASSVSSSSSYVSSSTPIIYGGGGGGGGYYNYSSSSNISSSSSSSSVHNVASSSISNISSASSITDKLKSNNETLTAYEWAKKIGLTSQPTYEEFVPYGPLLRKHLAKYISIFATNVLTYKPVYNPKCRQFSDISQESREMQDYIVMSCELGMMGLWSDGTTVNDEFWPNREVPRAEFGSALSRLLYGTKYASYKGDPEYYKPHLNALKANGIMNQISDPWIVERRAWVVLMFQRYTQNFLNK